MYNHQPHENSIDPAQFSAPNQFTDPDHRQPLNFDTLALAGGRQDPPDSVNNTGDSLWPAPEQGKNVRVCGGKGEGVDLGLRLTSVEYRFRFDECAHAVTTDHQPRPLTVFAVYTTHVLQHVLTKVEFTLFRRRVV